MPRKQPQKWINNLGTCKSFLYRGSAYHQFLGLDVKGRNRSLSMRKGVRCKRLNKVLSGKWIPLWSFLEDQLGIFISSRVKHDSQPTKTKLMAGIPTVENHKTISALQASLDIYSISTKFLSESFS